MEWLPRRAVVPGLPDPSWKAIAFSDHQDRIIDICQYCGRFSEILV